MFTGPEHVQLPSAVTVPVVVGFGFDCGVVLCPVVVVAVVVVVVVVVRLWWR
ncbi:MAG TPA: hypothetical protein VH760_05580 [Gaiellaceae bacterium]|jgi:hypothetical protein